MPEESIHGCDCDATMRRALDSREWQNSDVSEISEQIQNHHDPAAGKQCAHEVAPRVAYFAADKRDVGPGRLRKKRADHCFAKKKGERKPANDAQTRLRDLGTPSVCPRIPPCRRMCGAVCAPAQ